MTGIGDISNTHIIQTLFNFRLMSTHLSLTLSPRGGEGTIGLHFHISESKEHHRNEVSFRHSRTSGNPGNILLHPIALRDCTVENAAPVSSLVMPVKTGIQATSLCYKLCVLCGESECIIERLRLTCFHALDSRLRGNDWNRSH